MELVTSSGKAGKKHTASASASVAKLILTDREMLLPPRGRNWLILLAWSSETEIPCVNKVSSTFWRVAAASKKDMTIKRKTTVEVRDHNALTSYQFATRSHTGRDTDDFKARQKHGRHGYEENTGEALRQRWANATVSCVHQLVHSVANELQRPQRINDRV